MVTFFTTMKRTRHSRPPPWMSTKLTHMTAFLIDAASCEHTRLSKAGGSAAVSSGGGAFISMCQLAPLSIMVKDTVGLDEGGVVHC